MKRFILAALLLATFTVDAQAGLFRRPLRSWNKTTSKQVVRTSRCRIVNGVRVCGQ